MSDLILCRVPRSHRRHDKLLRLLGFRPQIYFTLRAEGNFCYLNTNDYAKVKELVTKPNKVRKVMRCWSSGSVFSKRFEPNQPYPTP